MPALFTVGKPLKQHPKYAAEKRARDFWRRSDRASHTFSKGVDANGNPILAKLPAEDGDDYTWRKNLAVSPRFVSSIISLYNSLATRIEASRPKAETDGGAYNVLLEDADGMGKPLRTLMQEALRKAQIESVCYLLADTNADGAYETEAEAIGAGARPLIRRIDADSVVWWREWLGEIVEGVVLLCDQDGNDFAWHVTSECVQRVDLRREEEGEHKGELVVAEIGPDQAHKYGGCPLVRLTALFGDTDEPGEDSQAAPIAEQQRIITVLHSLEMIEVHKATFTMWCFIGVDAATLHKNKVGSGGGWALPQGADVKPMGSDPAQAESIRKSMDTAMARMFLAAGLSPGNPLETGAPESGAAKAFKYNETESRLAALAAQAEKAENTVRARALAGVGAADGGDCKWPRTFMSPDVEAELDQTIKTVSAQVPRVIKDAQIKQYAEQAFEFTPEQKQLLDEQLVAAQAEADAAKAADPFVNPPADRTVGT